MTTIIFYEKPGCANNTKQKMLLRQAGNTVIDKNLLTESWSAESLLPFLKNYPVADWFNRAAPRVKSGEVVPENLNQTQALTLLLADHLLIRRPLMQVGREYRIGFDKENIEQWLKGLSIEGDLETCRRGHDPARHRRKRRETTPFRIKLVQLPILHQL
ncbi:MAG: ArsC/Spx/MgsR family protein [Thiotrichaceae bacterium]